MFFKSLQISKIFAIYFLKKNACKWTYAIQAVLFRSHLHLYMHWPQPEHEKPQNWNQFWSGAYAHEVQGQVKSPALFYICMPFRPSIYR